MLNVATKLLSVILLDVIMLSVVAPNLDGLTISLSVISKPFLILINLTKCFMFIWIKSVNADLRYEWFLEEKTEK
jgi:hypothetical protein